MKNGSKTSGSLTELNFGPFGYPHPYKLKFVPQYRFVFQYCEFLVRRNEHQKIVPGLAREWKISEDRHSITFFLRPGLYTAEEVVQSLRRLLHAKQTTHSNLFASTSEGDITAVDELTVRIKTIGDAGALLSPLVMADSAVLPDDHWIRVEGEAELQVDWKKVRGPYVFEKGEFPLEMGKSLKLRPNRSHYLYEADQLDWVFEQHSLSEIPTLSDLNTLLEKTPSFTTLKYWNNSKLFLSDDQLLQYHQTNPNGVAFILPNIHQGVFKNRHARRTLLKHTLMADIPLFSSLNRANQIAQPGLSGRISEEKLNVILHEILSEPDFSFSNPIRFAVSSVAGTNIDWQKRMIEALHLPIHSSPGPSVPTQQGWYDGAFDMLFAGIGMSDTDPISGATFLFAKAGADADVPNGECLKILNAAKNTTDNLVVTAAIQKTFIYALENALIIPVHHSVNRHYHSKNVLLNINDSFAESVQTARVRLK